MNDLEVVEIRAKEYLPDPWGRASMSTSVIKGPEKGGAIPCEFHEAGLLVRGPKLVFFPWTSIAHVEMREVKKAAPKGKKSEG